MLSWKNFLCCSLALAGVLSFKHWLARLDVKEPHQQGLEASLDCYFDPECHAKVDWGAISELKEIIFAKMEYFRQHGDPAPVRPLMQKMSLGFLKAGVPEDRADYILTKWLEYGYPEALEAVYGNSSITVRGFKCGSDYGDDINQEYSFQGTTKDGRPYYQGTNNQEHYIYYDSYCADDTREPRWLLGQRPDTGRDHDLNAFDGEGCNNDFSIVSGARHLPGGRQTLAWQWCGNRGFTGGELAVVYKIHDAKAKAEARVAQADTTDCYFDKECHAKVDWSKVGPLKDGLFARLKELKAKHNIASMKALSRNDDISAVMREAHLTLARLGMPQDNIDRTVTKWLMYVFPEAFSADAPAPQPKTTAPVDACAKYTAWGPEALSGCKGCDSSYPGRVDDCMRCGSACYPKLCGDSPDKKACVHQPPFAGCHQTCMQKKAGGGEDEASAGVCGKFAGHPLALRGCRWCDSTFAGRTAECMGCGRKCFGKLCTGKDEAHVEGCVDSKEMSECHGYCMGGVQLVV